MSSTAESKPWDFSHVLGLVNSLSNTDSPSPTTNGFTNGEHKHNQIDIPHSDERDFATPSKGLGDFSRIFQYLGTPVSLPAIASAPTKAPAVQAPALIQDQPWSFASKIDYASDGAINLGGSSKAKATAVQAAELQEQSIEEPVTDTVSDGSTVPDTPTLTKSQRKKQNRRDRKAKEAALAAERAAKKPAATVSESEADVVSQQKPARKASAHVVASTPAKQYNLRARDPSGKAITTPDTLEEAASLAVKRVDAARKANAGISADEATRSQSKASAPAENSRVRQRSHPGPLPTQNGSISAKTHVQSQPAPQWPVQIPNGVKANHLVPSSVPPSSHSTAHHVAAQQHQRPFLTPARPQPPRTIEPMTIRSGEDRHWALLMKLIGDFYEDRKHLISPMNLTTHNNDPKGIHVFVDASNIFIGFNEQLKRSRNIPHYTQVPAVDLSFDALALLIERRRPVAKRVLVGSTPHLPAYDKAKAVGYECSILEKVYKARELTERQIFFKEHDRYGFPKRAKAPPANNVATLNGGAGNGNGSGSETNTPQYAPARMIEQGVDEILHLKILETIVDTDAPGTIVLATGDAAQAEYSEGFMAMAERALRKGWTVELVSWSKNISAMYTRRQWIEAWGARFRIVTLDDYAEELLDM